MITKLHACFFLISATTATKSIKRAETPFCCVEINHYLHFVILYLYIVIDDAIDIYKECIVKTHNALTYHSSNRQPI